MRLMLSLPHLGGNFGGLGLHPLIGIDPIDPAATRQCGPVRRHRRPAKREECIQALRHGSAASWRHVNLLGEYDFSDERLKDSVGIKPPKLID